MEQTLQNYDLSGKEATAPSQAGYMKDHLKIHSGEKPNKCNQCDYATSHAGHLRTHLKTHSGYWLLDIEYWILNTG